MGYGTFGIQIFLNNLNPYHSITLTFIKPY